MSRGLQKLIWMVDGPYLPSIDKSHLNSTAVSKTVVKSGGLQQFVGMLSDIQNDGK